jgi:hypothetical protein
VPASELSVRDSSGVGERGLGDGLACLLCVAAGDQAEGGADVLPGVPGLAGGKDILGGVFAGREFKVSARGEPSERFEVAHSGVSVLEDRPGDGLGSSSAGHVKSGPAGQVASHPQLLVRIELGHAMAFRCLVLRVEVGGDARAGRRAVVAPGPTASVVEQVI